MTPEQKIEELERRLAEMARRLASYQERTDWLGWPSRIPGFRSTAIAATEQEKGGEP